MIGVAFGICICGGASCTQLVYQAHEPVSQSNTVMFELSHVSVVYTLMLSISLLVDQDTVRFVMSRVV